MIRGFTLLLLASCAASVHDVPPSVRFINAPPVQAVDDRRDVAVKPAARPFVRSLYHYDGSIHRRLTRVLELQAPRRALGVNAHDEVPDSTWFTNRIGRRALSVGEIHDAPPGLGSPQAHTPFTIVSNKVGGRTIGFIIKDARGEKYLLKFDRRGFPEMETATQVIVGKLLWAAGYNVTEDDVVYIRRSDLALASDAVIRDLFGNTRPLDRAELDRKLAEVEFEPDGRIRALVSRMLDGKAIGSHAGEGVREDDPNDVIPHELRRDLRGAYSIFAWLDHNDIQEGNFLDMWVTDPRDPKRHYVKHYLLDFGMSLGALSAVKRDPRRSHEYYLDWGAMLATFATAGTLERSWEARAQPGLRGIGAYDVASYDPGAWKASTPAYAPLLLADAHDKFWGAKILIRFTREQIRAAVDAGQLSDPRSVEYLTDTLIARQRATAKYWFERVNPLDRFEVGGDELCFDDLYLTYGFAPARGTHYTVTSYDYRGQRTGPAIALVPGISGTTCTTLPARKDYVILRIETARPGFTGATYVHLTQDRVIGVWRP